MRILYSHRTQGRGVENVHIMGIVNAWRKRGHSVDIVSPPGVDMESGSPSKEQPANPERRWSFVTAFLPEIFFELLEIVYNVWAAVAFFKILRRHRYDMIFERYYFLGFMGLIMAKFYRIRFFIEVNYISSSPLVRERTGLIKPFERFTEKMLLKKADGVIVVSSYLKRQLMTIGVEEDKILVLPNAADPDKFDPGLDTTRLRQRLAIDDNKVVGFVGYFYPWHGIDLLLDSFFEVYKKIKELNYVLIGEGPTFDAVFRRIARHGLQDRIKLVGRVHHSLIPEYVALFDVAVMPNSNNYGSPMKVLEYMAMAKASVAPRLGPLEDIINDHQNGLLFEPNNGRHLAQKIVEILNDKRLRRQIGNNARRSIETMHNWDANAGKILSFYKNL